MGINVQEFWEECKEVRKQIAAEVQRSDFQPKDGSVYVTSLRNRSYGTIAGRVTLTTIKLAGQLMVEGTQRLSTAEEVAAHLAEHATRRNEIQGAAALAAESKRTYVLPLPTRS